jgi:hypothetical protein
VTQIIPHDFPLPADMDIEGLRRHTSQLKREPMSVTAISQASGADLSNLLNQSTGQAPAGAAFTASVNVLKKAIAQAQLSESEIVGGAAPDSGSQLNVFA